MPSSASPKIDPNSDVSNKVFAQILQLERKARAAESEAALVFRIVNETKSLFPYRQAVLWDTDKQKITGHSGVPMGNNNSPYMVWLKKFMASLQGEKEIRALTAKDIGKDIGKSWKDWLPAHGLVVPLISGGRQLGVLFLAADDKWTGSDIKFMEYLADAYAYSADKLRQENKTFLKQLAMLGQHKKAVLGICLALFLVLCMPVSITVLAPAEVVPQKPTQVRAAIEGIVDELHVAPNQKVAQGDLLISLDKRSILSEIKIAEKALQVANVEYRQAAQAALVDSRDNVKVAVLKAEMEEQKARLAHYRDLLGRADLRAAHDGIVIFDDVNDWAGRPVQIGETIMTLAQQDELRLNIDLPANDLIKMKTGADAKFFLNISPVNPLPIVINSISYRATVTPDGNLAYGIKAEFKDKEAARQKARLGLRGTAKLYGHKVPLIFYILRKPLASLRQAVGV